jgi:hypothetical protein
LVVLWWILHFHTFRIARLGSRRGGFIFAFAWCLMPMLILLVPALPPLAC